MHNDRRTPWLADDHTRVVASRRIVGHRHGVGAVAIIGDRPGHHCARRAGYSESVAVTRTQVVAVLVFWDESDGSRSSADIDRNCGAGGIDARIHMNRPQQLASSVASFSVSRLETKCVVAFHG